MCCNTSWLKPFVPCYREVPQARSLDKDWRASKGKPGSALGPSSKEWANYRSQTHEGQSRVPGASEQAERQPHTRPRHGRNNPEWMADAAASGSEDASGLSAAARRAKDFEAERQHMKEKWKQEQGQVRGAAPQPVRICQSYNYEFSWFMFAAASCLIVYHHIRDSTSFGLFGVSNCAGFCWSECLAQ